MQKRFRENTAALLHGIRHGIPIALGYFAVALTLGIAAQNAGMTAGQAALMSMLVTASAGEYAGITMIAASATYIETAVMEFVANARYLLMSCALSQKLSPDMKFHHRFIMGFYVTDEIFALASGVTGKLNPFYIYGAVLVASPAWTLGTFIGAVLGNTLPPRIVSALSVGLYGMFLASIIPPARKSRVLAGLVALSFLASGISAVLPGLSSLSEGTRTILLTAVLSTAAALLFPVKPDTAAGDKQSEDKEVAELAE